MNDEIKETVEQFESYVKFVFPQVNSRLTEEGKIEMELGIHTNGGIEQWLLLTIPTNATLEEFSNILVERCFDYDMDHVQEDLEIHYESENFRNNFTLLEAYLEFKSYHLYLRNIAAVVHDAVVTNKSKTEEELSVKLVGGLMEVSRDGIPRLFYSECDAGTLNIAEFRVEKMTMELFRLIHRFENKRHTLNDIVNIHSLQAALSEYVFSEKILPKLDIEVRTHDIRTLCEQGRDISTEYFANLIVSDAP